MPTMALGPSGSWQGSGKGVESTNCWFHHQLSSTFFSNRRFKASDFNVLLLCGGWRKDGAQKLEFSFFSIVRCSIEVWAGRHLRWQRQWNVDNDNNLALRVVSQHRVMACLSLRRSPVNPPLFDCRMKSEKSVIDSCIFALACHSDSPPTTWLGAPQQWRQQKLRTVATVVSLAVKINAKYYWSCLNFLLRLTLLSCNSNLLSTANFT